ncbi:rhomboid family intramembrane serine protease [Oricola cellulosilytica]|uniref:Rhomboid family intramembrane serine protease n=1 Tax=Oricola cellulosilytica TaxID=1429082 RepID=A0A4R0PC72_9HYPH|nr:rhomboid family intramembrane serine protease [Oricola cellulosilytica]TCD13684.1 rhomboid family intramembrane serine protease [Oricola cellulosilytica]
MFIPLHDANQLKHIKLQYVTLALIAVNVLVYLAFNLDFVPGFHNAAVFSLGYIPAVVNDFAELPPEAVLIPEELSLVSHAFLHSGFMHLGTNMLFLWVFGDNVEDALGHFRFLAFYLLCAAAGALAHGLLLPTSEAPLIGASGAISGVIGAYLLLHPKVLIWVLAFGRIPLRLPAFIPLVLWVGYQMAAIVLYPDDEISWAAHVGGVLTGMALVLVMRRRGVPLFDRRIVTPRAVTVGTTAARENPRSAPPRPWGRG